MKCKSCGFVDHSVIYFISIPERCKKVIGYKCEKYGCIVTMNSTCKGETNAEEQKAEQAAQ